MSTIKKSNKNKRPRTTEDEYGDLIVDVDSIGGKSKTPTKGAIVGNANKKRRKRDSASSDEERWLTAIESGKLEDVDDELKKIKPKDPSLMTARQRAMYDRGADGGNQATNPQLISLPTGYKEKVMTPEAIQKAAIKSLKRKQLADEKREKDKKKTMERILKKQESKALKSLRNRHAKSLAPAILYKQNVESTIMAFPSAMDLPIVAKRSPAPAKVVYCGMNCGNPKKYSCSKTGVALCSLSCYRKNISRHIL